MCIESTELPGTDGYRIASSKRYLLTELILCWNHNTSYRLNRANIELFGEIGKSRHLVKIMANGKNHGFRDFLLSLLMG